MKIIRSINIEKKKWERELSILAGYNNCSKSEMIERMIEKAFKELKNELQ